MERHEPGVLIGLYRLAGEGLSEAQALLGFAFDNGIAPAGKNPKLAGRFWRMAAQQGHPVALYNLGVLYSEGRGVAGNTTLAKQLLTLAAEKGVARAHYLLGRMAEAGKNPNEALKHYRECLPYRPLAHAKSRYALLLLKTADMSQTNLREEVFTQLRAAAERWDVEAQYTLARLHAEGVVVGKSLPEAVFWLDLARRNPYDTRYRGSLDDFIRAYGISRSDLDAGHDMVKAWMDDATPIPRPMDYAASIREPDPVL